MNWDRLRARAHRLDWPARGNGRVSRARGDPPQSLRSLRRCLLRSLLRRQGVPDANREVAGAGDQPRAIGAPLDRVDVGVVAAQLGHFRVARLLAAGPPGDTDVPQADRVVGT